MSGRTDRGRPRWATWIAEREIWPLALGVALATFTQRWAALGLGLLGALIIVRWLSPGRLTVPTPLVWPACLLLLTIPGTLWVTVDRRTTSIYVMRLVAGLALTYGLANWARRRAHLVAISAVLASMAAALALYAPVSVIGSEWLARLTPSFGGQVVRVGDTVNANMMAGALAILLPFPLALVLWDVSSAPTSSAASDRSGPWGVPLWRLLRRVWFGIAALLTLAALALSQSRGGWLAGGVVLLMVLSRRWRGFWWAIPVVLLGIGVLVWLRGPSILLDTVSPGTAFSGWEDRAEIWSRAIYAIQDAPYTGVGAGTFPKVVGVLYPLYIIGPDRTFDHTHNLALQVAVDLGIPGLVAYMALLALALTCAFGGARRCRQCGDGGLSALVWASAASLVGLLVHGTVDATSWVVGRSAFIPWAVIGLAVASRLQARDERAAPS